MTIKEHLKILSSITAVTGHEKIMSAKIAELFMPLADDVTIDALGNVFAIKKGEGQTPKTVLVTAHYDEIGMVVTGIEKSGFLRFASMGGIDAKSLPAQEVTVLGRETLYGVIGAKPPHLLSAEEMEKNLKIEDLRIDIGFSGDEAKKRVRVGDTVGFRFPLVELKNHRVASNALDNRAGVSALLGILEELKNYHHEHHVIVAATVQEEVGLRGAIVSAYSVAPDFGITIDVCHADMPDSPIDEQFPLGKGVAVAIGPVVNMEKTNAMTSLADKEHIAYQMDPEPGSTGTEASALAIAREGIPVVLLSIPCRYMHTTVETISLDDVECTAKLASRYIASNPWKEEEVSC